MSTPGILVLVVCIFVLLAVEILTRIFEKDTEHSLEQEAKYYLELANKAMEKLNKFRKGE